MLILIPYSGLYWIEGYCSWKKDGSTSENLRCGPVRKLDGGVANVEFQENSLLMIERLHRWMSTFALCCKENLLRASHTVTRCRATN